MIYVVQTGKLSGNQAANHSRRVYVAPQIRGTTDLFNQLLSSKENFLQSAIGQHFEYSPAKRRVAIGCGVAVISIDWLLLLHVSQHAASVRTEFALIAFAIFVYLTDGDLQSLGIRLRPKQGWKPWIWISTKLLCIVAICVVAGLGAWHLMGNELKAPNIDPAYFTHYFLHACVKAPILEETIYRVVVCLPLVSMIGCWKTIGISGILFASLHFVYGNPGPANLVGGFLLAWAYLKSETILLPLLLHSVGNFLALCCQLAALYHLHSAG